MPAPSTGPTETSKKLAAALRSGASASPARMEQEYDKEFLHGRYEAQELRTRARQDEWDRMMLKATHKSLDVAREDTDPMGDLRVHKTQTGITWKEIAAAGTLALAGLGIWTLAPGKTAPPADTAAPPAAVAPPPPATIDTDTTKDFEIYRPKP